jgi:hypothetical protein
MSSWRNADFRVIPDDRGMYPMPERDGEGIPRYKARVKPNSETEYKNLQNNVSMVTTRRGLGTYLFTFTIDAGVGEDDLIVPINSGQRGLYTAILVACSPLTYGRSTMQTIDDHTALYFECECEWIITQDDITPSAVV